MSNVICNIMFKIYKVKTEELKSIKNIKSGTDLLRLIFDDFHRQLSFFNAVLFSEVSVVCYSSGLCCVLL